MTSEGSYPAMNRDFVKHAAPVVPLTTVRTIQESTSGCILPPCNRETRVPMF